MYSYRIIRNESTKNLFSKTYYATSLQTQSSNPTLVKFELCEQVLSNPSIMEIGHKRIIENPEIIRGASSEWIITHQVHNMVQKPAQPNPKTKGMTSVATSGGLGSEQTGKQHSKTGRHTRHCQQPRSPCQYWSFPPVLKSQFGIGHAAAGSGAFAFPVFGLLLPLLARNRDPH